ncbi:MAG: multifunctional 2',3'-cyclic-nucleotide 2'-phosphodiesterase/5'-nucleotidase/3'-nucleotidase [Deltaproteobacteria bacterium HGW-Deltaproteobacteria-1]|jgi:2',3'-cyclic-nucleotide 2'-phosphodiesterase (5'-nucleotidase family)|nr:MAG: multifunctional 2',3'-cyclic-nucleotide 2'-phosphodiesterase/5'-nucleotidase/3'-nucleotidase [Deltaproteobacteria bacterium HGW-Deltaproteobacteria-1]
MRLFLKVLCLLAAAAVLMSCATQHEIRILHVNDFHGFAAAYKPYGSEEDQGGLAYLAQRVEELRAEKPTLLFAAGDMIQGNNWANLFQGKSSIEAMNVMKFDAMVVGNHEFDFGQTILKQRIEEANFPFLGANVTGLSQLKPFIINNLDGLSIAVIGIVTGDTPTTTHPKNVSGLQFSSPVDTVEKYVRKLRAKNDIIVVLSHIGFSADVDLAKKVEGIDVIVGGHSHTKVAKPVVVGKTHILQAFEHGKVLGVIDLTVKNGRIIRADSRLEPISPTGKENQAVGAIVAKYQQKVDSFMNDTVGESLVDLDGVNVRQQETNLGNLITDIMRKAAGADAAIINGGTIRTSIKKGQIKVSDVYAVVPFDNYIVAIKLTGKQIRETLEHGVSAIDEGAGRFPQVSGLAFTYNRLDPAGSRVKDVFIGGHPLVADKEYTVATNDFLAAGGDGYKAFGDAVKSSKDYAVIGGAMKGDKLVYINAGKWIRDVVIEYIKSRKKISLRVEGRIREVK